MKISLIAVLGGIGFIILILAVLVGGNWLLLRLKKTKLPSADSLRRYRERLLNPRWDELEEQLGQSIPERIKQFYRNTDTIKRHDIRVTSENGATYHIARFLPADVETLDGIWPDVKESASFPLATDAFGDCFCIPLTRDKSEQCPVKCYHHDGSDFESVSSSLDEFLNGIEEPYPG
jgi:SMI1 / KNR4 family (SUKH-1)